MFLLGSQVIFGLLHPGVSEVSLDSTTDVSPATVLVSAAIYAMVFGALLLYWRSLPSILLNNKLVLCLPVLAVLSVIWSQDASLTMRRALVLLVVSCIGVCFGSIFTSEELSKLVAITGLTICVVTFLLAAAVPSFGKDPLIPGVWRGMFSHKNAQGTFMSLVFLSALHSHFQRSWLKYVTLVLAFALMVLSHSSTAVIALVVALISIPFWRATRVPMKHVVLAVVVVLVAAGLLIFLADVYSAPLLSSMGKNMTLTGRTELWALILQSIARRPLLGYGYNGFWLGLKGESLSIISASGWVVYHAHNGMLDILLGLGLVGGILFLVTLFQVFLRAVRHARNSDGRFGELWPGTFLVLLLTINLTESLLMSANSIFWLLYVAIYANLARQSSVEEVESATLTDPGRTLYMRPPITLGR